MKKAILLCCISILLQANTTRPAFNLAKNKWAKGYVYIPEGEGFYISSTEVSNEQYRTFLQWLSANGEQQKLNIAAVDSTLWAKNLAINQPFVNYYFNHPAYAQYPVVNISKEAAELYCEWLTEQYNVKAHEKLRFRLPTEAEWMAAARAGNDDAVYPWPGNSLYYGKKGRWQGEPMCNVRITAAKPTSEVNSSTNVTAPVQSYLSNGYGVYNMSGNVAEMISDKPLTKGGSWNSSERQVAISATQPYAKGPEIGFRPVAVRM